MAEPMEVVALVRSALRKHGALSFDRLLEEAYDHYGAITFALGYLSGKGELFQTQEHLHTLKNTGMVPPEPALVEKVKTALDAHPLTFGEISEALNEPKTAEIALALGWLMAQKAVGVTGTGYEVAWTLLN